MQASNIFKKSFLKLMLKDLKLNSPHFKSMSIQERKQSIKLSADTAMALARGNTKWSAALLIEEKMKKEKNAINRKECKRKMSTSKKILRRSLRSRMRGPKNVEASVVARRMVKKRTMLLRRIVPGGDSLDSFSLLDETLDYVIHLQAQVNLMQWIVVAIEDSN